MGIIMEIVLGTILGIQILTLIYVISISLSLDNHREEMED